MNSLVSPLIFMPAPEPVGPALIEALREGTLQFLSDPLSPPFVQELAPVLVCNVKHVNDLLGLGGNLCGANIHAELGEGAGDQIQKTQPVLRPDIQDGVGF